MKLVILVWQFQQLDIAVSSSRVALIAQLDIAIVHRVSALDCLYMTHSQMLGKVEHGLPAKI